MKLTMGVAALTSVIALGAAQQPQFRTSIARVRLDVRVSDQDGPIRGLTGADFVVEDNGVRQSIELESGAGVPLDLVLVAQPIGSVSYIAPEQAARVTDGLTAFLQQITARDRLAAVVSGAPPSLLRGLEYGAPSFDVQAFAGGVYAAPFDAIVAALGQFDGTERARALIVFTNAADFRSTTSFENVAELTQRLGPAFVMVGTPVTIRESARVKAVVGSGSVTRETGLVTEAGISGEVFPATLKLLADRTGGITVNLGSGEPGRVIADMFTWLRTSYTITYEPPAGKGWHAVKVTVNRREATVQVREGYFVE